MSSLPVELQTAAIRRAGLVAHLQAPDLEGAVIYSRRRSTVTWHSGYAPGFISNSADRPGFQVIEEHGLVAVAHRGQQLDPAHRGSEALQRGGERLGGRVVIDRDLDHVSRAIFLAVRDLDTPAARKRWETLQEEAAAVRAATRLDIEVERIDVLPKPSASKA
jgi:hypothetical protein